jgi:hypothetical protein
MTDLNEERVFWQETYFSETFDFRGRVSFCRFDNCTFVKSTILLDHSTEQLAFTACVFKDCNISALENDEDRALISENNFFDRPIEDQRRDFERRLSEALAVRAGRSL